MRMRAGLGIGAIVGYVLGAKAGTQRYDDLKKAATKVTENPIAQSATAAVQQQAGKVESLVMGKLGRTKQEAAAEDVAADSAEPGHVDSQSEALDHMGEAIGESWAASIDATEADLPDSER